MSFKGPPLEPNTAQLRLLQLLPRDDAPFHFIRCSLHVLDLDENPTYSALSYTWKPMHPQHSILIDQHIFPIGDNLWQFFSVAADGLQEGSMYIWVDQICINQNDLDERNGQVSLMGRIYSQAEQTFVWLGPEAENSHVAMSFLKDLWHTKMSDADIVNKHKQILPMHDLTVAVASLFQRPYWSRLWIVQEFWLSRYLMFVCGASVVQFHDNCVSRARAYFLSPNIKPVLQLQTIRFVHRQLHHPPHIAPLIYLFGDRQCSKAHDKVYGLIGHTSEKEDILVDYSMSIEKLALQVLQIYPAVMLNSFDLKVTRSILSGAMTDSAMIFFVSDVLFHIARGNVPFNKLFAGRVHGNEELSRMCQTIVDSMERNLDINLKYIKPYCRLGVDCCRGEEPEWFFRRRYGIAWAMRGVVKPTTPELKRAAKTLAKAQKDLMRSRSSMVKSTERYVSGTKRTLLQRTRFAWKSFMKRAEQEGNPDAVQSGI